MTLNMGKTDRSANPSPGNKKGGLANVVEKALGSIAKSGKSAIVEVLSPGQRPTQRGLICAGDASQRFCLWHATGGFGYHSASVYDRSWYAVRPDGGTRH